MAFFGYDTFRDMFDGGGAGAVGQKFEGGGLLSDFANFFFSPEGAEARARLAAYQAQMGGGGYGGGSPAQPAAEPSGLLSQPASGSGIPDYLRAQPEPQMPLPVGQSTTPQTPDSVPFGGFGQFDYNVGQPSATDQMPVKDFNGGDSWYFPLGQPGGGRIDTDPRSQAGAMQRAPASEFPPQFIQEFAQTFRGADIAAAERGGQLQGAYDLWRRNGNTFGGTFP